MQGWVDLVHVIPMAVARSSQVATQGVESAVNNSFVVHITMLRMAAAQSVFLWWRCDMRFRFYGWRYICTYNGQEGGVGLYAYGTINWTMNISPKADWLLACCVSGQFSVRYRPTKRGMEEFCAVVIFPGMHKTWHRTFSRGIVWTQLIISRRDIGTSRQGFEVSTVVVSFPSSLLVQRFSDGRATPHDPPCHVILAPHLWLIIVSKWSSGNLWSGRIKLISSKPGENPTKLETFLKGTIICCDCINLVAPVELTLGFEICDRISLLGDNGGCRRYHWRHHCIYRNLFEIMSIYNVVFCIFWLNCCKWEIFVHW